MATSKKAKATKAIRVTDASIRKAEQAMSKLGEGFDNAVLWFVLQIAEAFRTELWKDEDNNPRSFKWVETNKIPGHINNCGQETLTRCIKGCMGFMASWGYTIEQLVNIAPYYRMLHLCRPFTNKDASWNKDGRPNKAEVTKWLKGQLGHQSKDIQKRMGKVTETTTAAPQASEPIPVIAQLANGISAVRQDEGKTCDDQAILLNIKSLIDMLTTDEAKLDLAVYVSKLEAVRAIREKVNAERKRATKAKPKAKPKAKTTAKPKAKPKTARRNRRKVV